MSKAGQNTVTGISAQADISLLKLLESFQDESFLEILLEDRFWEDFTLVFHERTESYEVKWHKKPLSYSDVRSIVRKETKKTTTHNYSFKIIAKSFSAQFKKDFENLKSILPYLNISKGNRPFVKNQLVKKFKNKKWKNEEIAFIRNTELISLGSNKNIGNKISDLFRYQWDVFLSEGDLNSLIAVCFREILENAKTGSSISRERFNDLLNDFAELLAKKSESFTPSLSTAVQTKNLEKFLISPAEFRKLDNEIYLTPLTHRKNRALITYISKKIETNSFSTEDVEFFIEKVLLKSPYIYTCVRLLELKSNAGLLDDDYYVDFITKNYKKLGDDFVVHDALKLLLASARSSPALSPKILSFLQTSIFQKRSSNNFLQRADLDFSYKFQHLPDVIEVIGNQLHHSEQFINILFKAFDFTGDYYQLPADTPDQIYALLKTFIQLDRKKNWPKLLKKIGAQFNQKYNLPFKGYEHSGGSTGMIGWSFSFTDIGLVRKLYEPFLRELLIKDSSDFISFLKSNVFNSKPISSKNPVLLKRAAVGPLIDLICNSMGSVNEIEAAKKMLLQLAEVRLGIPSAQDALFANLRGCNLAAIGHDLVFELLKKDTERTTYRVPSSVFAMETALKLLDEGYSPINSFLLSTLRNKNFRTSWGAKEFIGVLGNPNLLKNNQQARFSLIDAFDIKEYLKQENCSDWLNGDFIKNHLRDSFQHDPDRAIAFLKSLLSDRKPSEKILNILSATIHEIGAESPEKIWAFFKDEITNPATFHLKYKKSPHFRQSFSRLAEALIKKGDLKSAKKIIELLIRDSDPNTTKNKLRHEELKNGGSANTIVGVRTQVPWILQKFALRKDVESLKYALNKLQVTLDLNGTLFKEFRYYDRDFYVMANSIVPLTELAHPYRRKILKRSDSKRRDLVKALALQIVKFLKREIAQKKIRPVDVCSYLVRVFWSIRDLNTAEAELVLNFFESLGIEEAAALEIYFAVFRKDQFRSIPFKSNLFKKRLHRICRENGAQRSKISWHLWKTLEDTRLKANKIRELDDYVDAFFSVTPPDNLGHFNFILESALTSPNRYKRYYDLMKSVMIREIEFLSAQTGKDRHPKLHFRKIAGIIRERSLADFFELFEIIIKASDSKTGAGVYGFNLHSFLEEFKKVGEVSGDLAEKQEDVRRFLLGIGALEN